MGIGNNKKYVLYADDDADDRMLLSDTFQSVAPDFKIETVPDGFAAIKYLEDGTSNLPCLLILDLNMPGMNGKEVIKKIRSEEQYESMPIVVFTTSSNPADKQECARFGVDMITKPVDLRQFEQTATQLLKYCG